MKKILLKTFIIVTAYSLESHGMSESFKSGGMLQERIQPRSTQDILEENAISGIVNNIKINSSFTEATREDSHLKTYIQEIQSISQKAQSNSCYCNELGSLYARMSLYLRGEDKLFALVRAVYSYIEAAPFYEGSVHVDIPGALALVLSRLKENFPEKLNRDQMEKMDRAIEALEQLSED